MRHRSTARRLPRTLGLALAAAAATGLAGCDMLKLADQERQYVRDRQILTRVEGVLAADPALADERIDVRVFLRDVTLSGPVEDAADRERAAELASNVFDVRRVETRFGSAEPRP